MTALRHALRWALAAAALAGGARAADPGTRPLTPREIEAGWRLLWDGRTTRGWRSVSGPAFPERDWRIRDGVLTSIPPGGGAHPGGDIITVDRYADFELMADFKVTPRGQQRHQDLRRSGAQPRPRGLDRPRVPDP
jgi:hypothetical protein